MRTYSFIQSQISIDLFCPFNSLLDTVLVQDSLPLTPQPEPLNLPSVSDKTLHQGGAIRNKEKRGFLVKQPSLVNVQANNRPNQDPELREKAPAHAESQTVPPPNSCPPLLQTIGENTVTFSAPYAAASTDGILNTGQKEVSASILKPGQSANRRAKIVPKLQPIATATLPPTSDRGQSTEEKAPRWERSKAVLSAPVGPLLGSSNTTEGPSTRSITKAIVNAGQADQVASSAACTHQIPAPKPSVRVVNEAETWGRVDKQLIKSCPKMVSNTNPGEAAASSSLDDGSFRNLPSTRTEYKSESSQVPIPILVRLNICSMVLTNSEPVG